MNPFRIGSPLVRFVSWLLLLCGASSSYAQRLLPDEQFRVILDAATLIEARYVDPQKGKAIATALRASRARWTAQVNSEEFAKEATTLFRAVSADGHLGLSYSSKPLPEAADTTEFSQSEMNRWYGPQINHGIEKIERLPGNIILLDLRVFPPPEMAGDVFSAAMTVVAQGDALILDLRRNGGGAGTSNLLTGYLVAPGSPLSGTYDRPSNRHSYSTAPAWVPGRRFGTTKPLFILTSKKTFSAAEAVAYDLQALGRAVIVGEVTGGGAHPFEYRRVHRHFAVDLPEGKSINPITGSNWQGVGVKPNVQVPAEQALSTAIELAKAALATGRK
jgi:Peptidase family S41